MADNPNLYAEYEGDFMCHTFVPLKAFLWQVNVIKTTFLGFLRDAYDLYVLYVLYV